MSLNLANVRKELNIEETNTGSTAIQITLLTDRIAELSSHLKTHNKDNHSRYGLILIIKKRQRLLKYLKQHAHPDYTKLVSLLKIRTKD